MRKMYLACAFLMLAAAHPAMAHIWRVNNDPARTADFVTINDAIAAAAAGDTIHVEPSKTPYPAFLLNKRLVIIGNGYFLGGGSLQADKDSSVTLSMTIDSSGVSTNASGSVIMGITVQNTAALLHNVRNITITRCNVAGQFQFTAYDRATTGISISKCFIQSFLRDNNNTAPVTADFENNIFSTATGTGFSDIQFSVNINGIFRNNTFNTTGLSLILSNFYISNNVFITNSLTSIDAANNTVVNNVFASAAITGVTSGQNGNLLNVATAALFTGNVATGYGDARFQTQPGGLLRGNGEDIGGIRPDIGAYNTVAATDTYRTSGIPPTPTIYGLTVPASIDKNATTMDITISTRSNN